MSKTNIASIAEQLYSQKIGTSASYPSASSVEKLIQSCTTLLFQDFYNTDPSFLKRHLTVFHLTSLFALNIAVACRSEGTNSDGKDIAHSVIEQLPAIQDLLHKDVQEVMDRDPAAHSISEIVLSYPGFRALTVHRIAHLLHLANVPLLPRMMSEVAHSTTGIDIHPGATIAPYCSIDHGTGLVIGETAVLGEHVSLYHNVTLGAKSVSADLKNTRRHPTIGNNVIIYPGATILGDITIGDNCIIAGNVTITKDCDPNLTVRAEPPELISR